MQREEHVGAATGVLAAASPAGAAGGQRRIQVEGRPLGRGRPQLALVLELWTGRWRGRAAAPDWLGAGLQLPARLPEAPPPRSPHAAGPAPPAAAGVSAYLRPADGVLPQVHTRRLGVLEAAGGHLGQQVPQALVPAAHLHGRDADGEARARPLLALVQEPEEPGDGAGHDAQALRRAVPPDHGEGLAWGPRARRAQRDKVTSPQSRAGPAAAPRPCPGPSGPTWAPETPGAPFNPPHAPPPRLPGLQGFGFLCTGPHSRGPPTACPETAPRDRREGQEGTLTEARVAKGKNAAISPTDH